VEECQAELKVKTGGYFWEVFTFSQVSPFGVHPKK
jgi:hypothetical protein